MKLRKNIKNTGSIIKLASLYLMVDEDKSDPWKEQMQRRLEIDQDPRYDIYRHNPRYNDVWTPPNYWETHPDDPRNPYRQKRNVENEYDEEEYYDDEEYHEDDKNNEVDNNDLKSGENTPATTDNNTSSNKTSSNTSDDGLGGSLCVFCVAVVLIVGILSVAPWLLIIIIPIILCAILSKKG